MSKSPDAFRTISEVADWLGTPTHVLRFWESRFAQVKPVKRAGGRRYYRPSDMALLGGIKRLLHDDGMTIRGVQKILREKGIKHVAALSPTLDFAEAPFAEDAIEAEPVDNVVPLSPRERLEDDAAAGAAPSGAEAPAAAARASPPQERSLHLGVPADAAPMDTESPAASTISEPVPAFEHTQRPHAPAAGPASGAPAPSAPASTPIPELEPEPEPEPGPSPAEEVFALLAAGARPDPSAVRPLYKRLGAVRQRILGGHSASTDG